MEATETEAIVDHFGSTQKLPMEEYASGRFQDGGQY